MIANGGGRMEVCILRKCEPTKPYQGTRCEIFGGETTWRRGRVTDSHLSEINRMNTTSLDVFFPGGLHRILYIGGLCDGR